MIPEGLSPRVSWGKSPAAATTSPPKKEAQGDPMATSTNLPDLRTEHPPPPPARHPPPLPRRPRRKVRRALPHPRDQSPPHHLPQHRVRPLGHPFRHHH